MHTFVYLALHIFRLLLDLLATRRLSNQQKDMVILLLRHQLRILQRKHPKPPRISAWEKGILAVLAAHFNALTKATGHNLDEVILLFKPDTVLRWHRQLVRRKWTFRRIGRPRVATELEQLIVRLATENPRWGYSKIEGELLKLGHSVSRSSVRNVLKRRRVPPSTRRGKSSSWHSFLGHYAGQMIACDFLTIETIRLRTVYILFFIELGSRRVTLAGCTTHPTSDWVTQQARNLAWDLGVRDQELSIRFLIHDRDAKFTPSFNTVFKSEGIETILTPYRSPKANANTERWVRTVREECLDHLLIISETHLMRVLGEYVEYYNRRRPHQGIAQQMPIPLPDKRIVSATSVTTRDRVGRRDVLGGVVHDYYSVDSHAA